MSETQTSKLRFLLDATRYYVICRFEIALEGLYSGHGLLVGFCVPLAAGPEDLVLSGHPHPVERDTYHQLRQDNSGTGYY